MDVARILFSLKKVLKEKGCTYKDLALMLGLSEVSVKRIFSEKNCSLSRLEDICSCLEISVFDLLDWAKNQHEETFTFTLEQEEYFAKNYIEFEYWDRLYKLRKCPFSTGKIMSLDKKDVRRILRMFEKFGIIEVHINDRIKFLVRGTLNLIDGGPLQKKMTRQNMTQFLDSVAKEPPREEYAFTMSHRLISRKNLKLFSAEIKRVFQDFRDRAYRDEKMTKAENLLYVQWLGGIVELEGLEYQKIK